MRVFVEYYPLAYRYVNSATLQRWINIFLLVNFTVGLHSCNV